MQIANCLAIKICLSRTTIWIKKLQAICTIKSFCYYELNPTGFSFLEQIRAVVIHTLLGLPNLNMKQKLKRILLVVVK